MEWYEKLSDVNVKEKLNIRVEDMNEDYMTFFSKNPEFPPYTYIPELDMEADLMQKIHVAYSEGKKHFEMGYTNMNPHDPNTYPQLFSAYQDGYTEGDKGKRNESLNYHEVDTLLRESYEISLNENKKPLIGSNVTHKFGLQGVIRRFNGNMAEVVLNLPALKTKQIILECRRDDLKLNEDHISYENLSGYKDLRLRVKAELVMLRRELETGNHNEKTINDIVRSMDIYTQALWMIDAKLPLPMIMAQIMHTNPYSGTPYDDYDWKIGMKN